MSAGIIPQATSTTAQDPVALSTPGCSKQQSHVGHATPASFSTTTTTDPAQAMPTRRSPLHSPNPFPHSAAAINTPLSSRSDHHPAHTYSPSLPSTLPPDVRAFDSPPAAPNKPPFNSRGLAIAIPRTPTLPFAFMGQGLSKSSSPNPNSVHSPSSSSVASKGFQAALAGGNRLKRAIVSRRKKSEDVTRSLGSQSKGSSQQSDTTQPPAPNQLPQHGRHLRVESCVPLTSSVPLVLCRAQKPLPSVGDPTSTMAAEQLSSLSLTPTPPPPPPKPRPQQLRQLGSDNREKSALPPPPSLMLEQVPQRNQSLQAGAKADNRNSLIPLSPGIVSAVSFMNMSEGQWEQKEQSMQGVKPKAGTEDRTSEAERERPREKPREADSGKWEVLVADIKDARRKSDSTMSYQTIRPGTTSNRTSRPVSMAESLQSIHTIKPVRISALITDAEFSMLEEDVDSFKATIVDAVTAANMSTIVHPQQKASPTPSLKTKSRRSLSLNLGPYTLSKSQPPPPPASHHTTISLSEMKYPSYSITEGMPPPRSSPTPGTAKEVPKIVQTSVTGQIGSVPSPSLQVTGHNLRGKLSSWTNPSPSERKLPALPPQMPPSNATSPSAAHPPQSLRAISMTSGLAPAAGRAWRAVGRVGRAIGISSSSSNSASTSGYSSSVSTPSDGQPLTRTNSNQSSSASHVYLPLVRGRRRTPNAPSGSWSVSSSMTSGSVSDTDQWAISASPSLGVMLRAPMRGLAMVFGRDLKSAVRETAVTVHMGDDRRHAGERERARRRPNGKFDDDKRLEDKALPAVIVRCTQHLLIWGVEEEGLFRVSGRSKHVASLRAEFDKGADYDMSACEPGDLDPHAVASVFKAYFRELPEHMLTSVLSPYFEGIVEREMSVHNLGSGQKSLNADGRAASRGPGLPSGPKAGGPFLPSLKKPPSLSTLAMPSFKDMPPPSISLIRAIRALISQLPEENRDLLRTLIEVMNATARNDKATKMPLANLLLVFCPTVQMTPPLLRVLCEAQEIWKEEEEMPVVDLKKEESENLDIGRASAATSGIYIDAPNGMEERESLYSDGRVSEESPPSMSDYHASTEGSIKLARPRPSCTMRDPEATVYMDAECGCSSASLLPHPTFAVGGSRDNVSLVSDNSVKSHVLSPSSSPRLSSSAESLATPVSSGQPSLSHLPMNEQRKVDTEPCYASTEGHDVLRISDAMTSESTRVVISNPMPVIGPVQFPCSSASMPCTPLKRRSIPLLSLPHYSPMGVPHSTTYEPPSPTESSHSSRKPRMKKPSLQILLSKRSNSSLKSITKTVISNPILNDTYVAAPKSASDSSVSTPQSAVTAPQGSLYMLPPVLNTPIENSPLGLAMGLQVTPPDTAALVMNHHCKDDNNGEDVLAEEALKLGQTPIADRYRSNSATSSVLSLTLSSHSKSEVVISKVVRPSQLRPAPKRRSRDHLASPGNRLGMLEQDFGNEDDWTKSVLLAADSKSDWRRDGK
ncbi:hypothetical protein AX17_001441 [Amanita inopinata Kibby_2008]|nr:hypothetical protein AX17_001441 [Amanita inopinata Kibby_2008]